jgi:hypothetical protein
MGTGRCLTIVPARAPGTEWTVPTCNIAETGGCGRPPTPETQEVVSMGSLDPLTLAGMCIIFAGLVLWLVADFRKAK